MSLFHVHVYTLNTYRNARVYTLDYIGRNGPAFGSAQKRGLMKLWF